jgi:hypothetical protein
VKRNKIKLLLCLFLIESFAFGQLSTTNLPIFIIDTEGKTIVDEPKILAKLKVIFNGEGKTNNVTSQIFHYNSFIGIELRGSSSQGFPKKPYSIELRNAKGENNPVELCGLPKNSDWILFPSYNEKSLMHNVLAMNLARKLGMPASRTRYVEVVLNGIYQGVYVLMEKIEVSKDRIDIADLKPEDTAGDQLTGGYIVKVDKTTGSNLGSFRSNYPNKNGGYSTYYYHLPKAINDPQKKYIRDYIRKFEDAVYSPNFKNDLDNYKNLIDLSSFAKLFLINEISRNIDGYRISTYYYKDRDSKQGKFTAGPPWDYDICFGNADYCQGSRHDLWAYRFNDVCPSDFYQVPLYWERMVADPAFIGELRSKYFEGRKPGGIFDYQNIVKTIDSLSSVLAEPQVRNFQRWNILGQYVWPGPRPIPTTWQGEVQELKSWLQLRLEWLDVNMPQEFILLENTTENNIDFDVFPNPFIEKLSVKIRANENTSGTIEIINNIGVVVKSDFIKINHGENYFNLEAIEDIKGVFIVLFKDINGKIISKKAVKR